MLHDRILVLVQYVTEVIAGTLRILCLSSHHLNNITGQTQKDYATLRSLSALVASLPASENAGFREEFETVHTIQSHYFYSLIYLIQEFEDVQLTAFLSTMTKSANILNDVGHRSLDCTFMNLTLTVGGQTSRAHLWRTQRTRNGRCEATRTYDRSTGK